MPQSGEEALRRFWADLVPAFTNPDQLLQIGDPDERAVTMLLKTLYAVFKGVLEDRHRLRCAPSTAAASAPVDTARGATYPHGPAAVGGAAAAAGGGAPPCPPEPVGAADASLPPTAEDDDSCSISLLEALPQARGRPAPMVLTPQTAGSPPLLQLGGELQLSPAFRTAAEYNADDTRTNADDTRTEAGGVLHPEFEHGEVQEGIKKTRSGPKKHRFVVIDFNDPLPTPSSPPPRSPPPPRDAQNNSVAPSTSEQATTDLPQNRTLSGTGKVSPARTRTPPKKASSTDEPASQTDDDDSFLEASPQPQSRMVLAPETVVPSPAKRPSEPPPVPETEPQASSELARESTPRSSFQPPSEPAATEGAGVPPEPAILAPETVDLSPVKPVGGKKRLPVPETQAGTGQLAPSQEAMGQQQVSSRGSGSEISHHTERTPVHSPPTSPQKSETQVRQARSPVLPGRSPASRRARRAGRSTAASSPAPPLFAEPLPADQRPAGGASRDQRPAGGASRDQRPAGGASRDKRRDLIPEAAATVPQERENSPVEELGSPLLLPQHGFSRLPPSFRTAADAVQTGARDDGAARKHLVETASAVTEPSHQASVSPEGSPTRTAPPPTLPVELQGAHDEPNAETRTEASGVSEPRFKYGEVQEVVRRTESGSKKQRLMWIGSKDFVPPRKPRSRAAQKVSAAPSTSDEAQATTDLPPNSTLSGTGKASPAKTRRPPKRACTTSTSVSVPRPLSRTATTAGSPAKAPTKRKQPSIFGPLSPPKQRASPRRGSVSAAAAGEPGPSRSSSLAGSEPSTSRERRLEAVAEEEGAAVAEPENLEESQDSGEETDMESQLFVAVEAEEGRHYDAGPVRKKAERKKLLGWSCDVCRKWYEGRDLTESQTREHMNRCSRHRQSRPPPAATPPGFWDPMEFPATEATQYGTPPGKRVRRRL